MTLSDSCLNKTTCSIHGNRNRINADCCSIYNSNFKIDGISNTLIIHSECSFANTHIIIKGKCCHVEIKDSSSINGATLVCMGNGNYIKIGTGCMFSDEIQIWNSDTHPIYDDAGKLTNPSKPITIGDRVWLGKRVTILKGVTIGSNCIVGMNSTVTKDLQGDTLYVGNPAKAIKKIGFWGKNHITE